MNDRERLIAIARAKQKQQQAAQPQTNLVEQVGTGTSEGIANMAGMPVDMLTKGLNLIPGVDIRDPVGGSESIRRGLSPFMSKAEPQTAAQRIGRRVGQDVGAGAVIGPLAGVSTVSGNALNLASNAASGLAGGATSEVTDNPLINAGVSIAAGLAVPGSMPQVRGTGAPSVNALRAEEGRLYKQVENSPVRMSSRDAQELQGAVSNRMENDGMYPPQHVAATGGVRRFYEMNDRHPQGTPSLQDVEDVRQYVNQNIAPSDVAGEARLGKGMKQEIDKFLRGVAERDPDAADDISAGFKAHELSRRRIAAEDVDRVFEKAGWRASTTGLGGNEINAIRQNIRQILDSPSKAAGYTKAERDQMEKIVTGSRATNAARFAGSLAPQRGLIGGGGAVAAGMQAYNLGDPRYLLPTGISMVAQAIGEGLTRRQINDLSAMIRSGKAVKRSLTDQERRVMNAVLATQQSQQSQR